VTNGEIKDGKFMDFWISACVNELVQQVQFVNLQRYLPFGYYHGKGTKLLKTGQWNLTNTDDEPQIYLQEISEGTISP